MQLHSGQGISNLSVKISPHGHLNLHAKNFDDAGRKPAKSRGKFLSDLQMEMFENFR